MNPYLFTITFLLMIGLLTSSEAVRFSQQALEKHCYKEARIASTQFEELRALTQLENLQNDVKRKMASEAQDEDIAPDDDENPVIKPPKSTPNKRAKALGVNAARPPNNSRLNFYTLLEKEPNISLPKEFSLYEVTARLMRALYKEEDFFKPGVEYRLLDKLLEKKEEALSFTTPDQLCELSFDDESLQRVFYLMLKGTKKSPSLLNYITFDSIHGTEQARKINFMFVDPIIIHAIFPEGNTADLLLAKREAIWAEIEYQECNRGTIPKEAYKGRQLFSDDTKNALVDILTAAGFKAEKYKSQVFDCTLNKPGTVLFIEDSTTHLVSREKYIPARARE